MMNEDSSTIQRNTAKRYDLPSIVNSEKKRSAEAKRIQRRKAAKIKILQMKAAADSDSD